MAKVIHARNRDEARTRTGLSRQWQAYQSWFVGAYAVAATIALIMLSFAAHVTPYFAFDLVATRVVQSVHAGWYDLLMRAVGEVGYPPQVYVLVLVIVLSLYFTGLKWEAVAEVFAIVGIGAVGLVIKTLVNRPRPTPDLVHVITVLDNGKMSFPAGHVESFIAILGFLWFLAFLRAQNVWVRSISLFVFGEMIAFIGISRLYTGEHWLSDVIGAYLFGSIWLILTIWFYNWGKDRFFVHRPKEKKAGQG